MKKHSELFYRICTAVLGGAALLSLLIWGQMLGVYLLTVVISVCMIFEFSNMIFQLSDARQKQILLVFLAILANAVSWMFPEEQWRLLFGTFVLLFTFFLFTAGRFKEKHLTSHAQELMVSVFGMIYLVCLPLFLPALRALPDGLHWCLFFLGCVWATDTAAYFVGKKWGNHRLYPQISPKKSFEGLWGGLAASAGVALIFNHFFFSMFSWTLMVGIALLVSIVSQVGDLCESFIKRAFHTKDAGSILPGHGGFLDRFDGVVFGLPVMYACVKLLN